MLLNNKFSYDGQLKNIHRYKNYTIKTYLHDGVYCHVVQYKHFAFSSSVFYFSIKESILLAIQSINLLNLFFKNDFKNTKQYKFGRKIFI